MMTSNTLDPTAPQSRIHSMDVLRGFAILGILIMNIQNFSMIEAAYLNPTAYGDLTGVNRWVWILSHILADQKFMTLFSLLYGAGILLVTERAAVKGLRPAGFHYRRTFWLLVIGLAHAYLLWHGDILVTYALCALWVFLFRKKPPKTQLILGAILILIPTLLWIFFDWSMQFWPPEAVQGNMQGWMPDSASVSHELAAYQGTWMEQMAHRVPSSLNFQIFIFLILFGWRVTGLMCIGMALFKWGVFQARRSKRFYGWMLGIGAIGGLLLIITGINNNFAADWTLAYSMFIGSQFNYWGSLFIAAAYIAMIMLICKSEKSKRWTSPWAAVGRMALTNYLFQTLICTTLFYGHGFGLFGRVERIDQILIVLGIWMGQLILSPVWLRYFRYGPAEWLWRSLTYKKIQPFIRRPSSV